MLRRLTPYLIAAAVALTSTLGFVSGAATGAPGEHADYVIIAGAAGLRWDDVNPVDTPTMWQLAQNGAVGALSVSSARSPTCPEDGWLTLGAGNFALRNRKDKGAQTCPTKPVKIDTPDAIGANLPDQDPNITELNQEQALGTQPGALAEAVQRTGPGRPPGRGPRARPRVRPGPLGARAGRAAPTPPRCVVRTASAAPTLP